MEALATDFLELAPRFYQPEWKGLDAALECLRLGGSNPVEDTVEALQTARLLPEADASRQWLRFGEKPHAILRSIEVARPLRQFRAVETLRERSLFAQEDRKDPFGTTRARLILAFPDTRTLQGVGGFPWVERVSYTVGDELTVTIDGEFPYRFAEELIAARGDVRPLVVFTPEGPRLARPASRHNLPLTVRSAISFAASLEARLAAEEIARELGKAIGVRDPRSEWAMCPLSGECAGVQTSLLVEVSSRYARVQPYGPSYADLHRRLIRYLVDAEYAERDVLRILSSVTPRNTAVGYAREQVWPKVRDILRLGFAVLPGFGHDGGLLLLAPPVPTLDTET